jgi:proteasome lid subunit RPN8/RPN11
MNLITISLRNWLKLFCGLKKRSKGIRESGAFLLSKRNSRRVCKVVFYDKFDKTVSDTGIIQFKGGVRFYNYLAQENLEVLADIHTHPGSNTSQSESDRTHPMIRIKGHIAIIAPNFAKSFFVKPSDCSVYLYLAEYKWKRYDNSTSLIKLKLF